ncbi:MAG: amidohydrolase [Deltaproteobacteria bacterium]|nr:amidohydrolase [Deltaproteobacteria bacterium]
MGQLALYNGTILTMDPPGTVIDNGLVWVEDARITYCGPADAPEAPQGPAARRLDAAGGLILPGLINCHTHASMTLLRGLADDLPLDIWLTQHIFPVESRLTAEAVYWGALLAAVEMIRSGCTSFCDMYLFASQVARAADEAGLRAVVGEVIYDFPSPSYGELPNGYRITEELLAAWQDHPRVRAAVMPHALYTCSQPLMERAGQIAAEHAADLNIHLAEGPGETAQVLAKWGRRPLAVLQDLDLVNRRLWVDHAIDLDQAEIATLAAAGVRVAHCPESNMKLASGVMPLTAMWDAGVKVGLGTDGCASNNNLDLLGEMDTAAKLAKAAGLDPTAAPAERVLALATSEAGRVFGREGELGLLRPGALADLIVVDTNQPHLTPLYHPAGQLVYAADGSDVLHTVCHGQVLMADRRLELLDEARILARAREAAGQLTGRDL